VAENCVFGAVVGRGPQADCACAQFLSNGFCKSYCELRDVFLMRPLGCGGVVEKFGGMSRLGFSGGLDRVQWRTFDLLLFYF